MFANPWRREGNCTIHNLISAAVLAGAFAATAAARNYDQPVQDTTARTAVYSNCHVAVVHGKDYGLVECRWTFTLTNVLIAAIIPAGKVLVIEDAAPLCRVNKNDQLETFWFNSSFGNSGTTYRPLSVQTQATD